MTDAESAKLHKLIEECCNAIATPANLVVSEIVIAAFKRLLSERAADQALYEECKAFVSRDLTVDVVYRLLKGGSAALAQIQAEERLGRLKS